MTSSFWMRSAAVLAVLTWFPATAISQDSALKKLIDESRRIALQVAADTRTQLLKEMQLSGPLRSLLVCKYSCPEITLAQSRKTGWKVSLVSLKPRNAANGFPDAWEQKVLIGFERRAANGEKADGLEYSEVVTEPQGKYFRYGRAMAVEPSCLACHGPSETLPEAVKAQLKIDYPFDQAVGFRVGEVYGMVAVKRPL